MFDDYYSYSTLRPQFITRISRLVKLFLLWLFLCEAMTGRRHSAAFERELIGLLKSLNEETNGLFLFLKHFFLLACNQVCLFKTLPREKETTRTELLPQRRPRCL